MESEILTPEEAKAEWNAQAKENESPDLERDPVIDQPIANDEPEVQAEVIPEVKPDPIQAQFEALQGQLRNLNGHIGGLTSEQKRLREMMSAAESAAQASDHAPTQNQINQAITNPEKWDALKADFPEWGEATEAYVDSRLAGLRTNQQDPKAIADLVSSEIEKAKGGIYLEAAKASIDAVFPGWEDKVKTDEFNAWKDQQSSEVQALAASAHVRDAVKMLRLFEDRNPPQVQAIQSARNKKLDAASSAPSRGDNLPPAKTVDELSPRELWNHEAKLLEKRRKDRGY
ncbi:hypothetical protein [Polynucleobacter asymbioticus]|uniref:Uncharacterized protein n=1 Tax=Polynucleobacter asymbioticus TaxID=576611 RepID=A0AAC9IRE6_9BURK|nr:hypothetical protein [Polynucleobacter asymbioticus]APB99027.1 hypothetical protein A4F89_06645 [Polynucleobacter asymbioticus]APC01329.1 hypothetical protein AOC25_06745 [Polynucleobacter asymbioticus]